MSGSISGSVLRPPLKWAGGKRWLVPHLLEQMPMDWRRSEQGRLVEPFCGGLAIALGLSPQRALLSDINPHLINFYRQIKLGLVMSIELRNDEGLYYQHRDRFNALIRSGQSDSSEAAQIFYYLNRTGFNGLCRFNHSGEYNVPFGRYKKINYVKDFLTHCSGFQGWEFFLSDFESLPIESGDWIYADPPYDVEFRQYSKEGFPWSDQVRLATWLAQQTVPVVASNQATERVLELYRDLGFEVQVLEAPRRIACTGDRTPALEMLAWKGFTQAAG